MWGEVVVGQYLGGLFCPGCSPSVGRSLESEGRGTMQRQHLGLPSHPEPSPALPKVFQGGEGTSQRFLPWLWPHNPACSWGLSANKVFVLSRMSLPIAEPR